MSCLKKLLPTRKAWKVFTTKLQSKLHKLQRSKAIKKPKNRLINNNKSVLWPLQSADSQRKRRTVVHASYHHHRRHFLHKRPAPVFIDELFIERSVSVSVSVQPPISTADHRGKRGATEQTRLPDDQPGTSCSKEDRDGDEKMYGADDMWESLALASPQMQGINERADEFISRFRAEMQLQEMLARR